MTGNANRNGCSKWRDKNSPTIQTRDRGRKRANARPGFMMKRSGGLDGVVSSRLSSMQGTFR